MDGSRPVATIKASNFIPYGNFGTIPATIVASLGESSIMYSCAKDEQNQVCKSKVFLQLLFSLFFCRTRFVDSKPSEKKSQKFT
jgi:hypothetical protein